MEARPGVAKKWIRNSPADSELTWIKFFAPCSCASVLAPLSFPCAPQNPTLRAFDRLALRHGRSMGLCAALGLGIDGRELLAHDGSDGGGEAHVRTDDDVHRVQGGRGGEKTRGGYACGGCWRGQGSLGLSAVARRRSLFDPVT